MNLQSTTSKLVTLTVIILSAVTIFYFANRQKGTTPATAGAEKKPDTTANTGVSRRTATLTLSDGKKIPLDATAEKTVGSEGGCEITIKNGKLTYTCTGNATPLRHKLSVPKGNRFELELPDSTSIALNAATEISYTVSAKDDRRVEFTGEAYFEIPQDANRPFVILANKTYGAVTTGGKFNINAHPGARGFIVSSLKDSIAYLMPPYWSLRGKALSKWYHSSIDFFIREGGTEQTNLTGEYRSNKVNETQILAWKNNRFGFDYMTLPEAINEITRWYDIEEVEYIDEPPYFDYTEIPSRDTPLPQLLKLLESAGARFRLEKDDKRIVVIGEKPKP